MAWVYGFMAVDAAINTADSQGFRVGYLQCSLGSSHSSQQLQSQRTKIKKVQSNINISKTKVMV